MTNNYQKQGFTLIEFMTVFFVFLILTTIVFAGYRLFEKRTELKISAQRVSSTLKLAQSKTLASEDASQYGIRFETNQYVLFKGDTYTLGSIENKIYSLPQIVEIYSIDLAGGAQDVVFERISGKTAQNGSVSLRIVSQPAEIKTVTITSSGHVEVGDIPPECCLTGRQTDTRHVHLNFNWPIQETDTLKLYFADMPDVTEEINLTDCSYLAGDSFACTAEVDVNGAIQKLYIHTHSLDEFAITLCVHRDRDENTKPVEISIIAIIEGSKEIISYAADGEIIPGFGFGGTAEIQ